MKIKLDGGPASGLTIDAAVNVNDTTRTVAVVERSTPPASHLYRQRTRGGRLCKTANGDPIYDYDITLPR